MLHVITKADEFADGLLCLMSGETHLGLDPASGQLGVDLGFHYHVERETTTFANAFRDHFDASFSLFSDLFHDGEAETDTLAIHVGGSLQLAEARK